MLLTRETALPQIATWRVNAIRIVVLQVALIMGSTVRPPMLNEMAWKTMRFTLIAGHALKNGTWKPYIETLFRQ